MKKILLLIFFSALFFSCSKKEAAPEPKEKSIFALMFSAIQSSEDYDGTIDLICDKVQTPYYTSLGSGLFHFAGELPQTAGFNLFEINDYAVPINGGKFYIDNVRDSNALRHREEDFWGQQNEIKLDGSVLGNIYLPQALEVSFTNNQYNITRAQGISLPFQQDPDYINSVVAVLHYSADMTGNEHLIANYPDPITKMVVLPNNATTIHFTPSDLAAFPAGSKVRLYLGRGVEEVYTAGGKKIGVLGLTITTIPRISILE